MVLDEETAAGGLPSGRHPGTGAGRKDSPFESDARTAGAPTHWFSRRSLLLHLAVLTWVPGCGLAAWWQVTVAMSGNDLGWLYAVEWPVFAVLGVIGWWQLVHDDAETLHARRARRAARSGADAEGTATEQEAPATESTATPGPLSSENVEAIRRAEDEDERLAAYNAYLASLSSSGTRKSWRDPTGGGSR